ncbi:MAG: PDZ domain-containing protein [Phycisphaerales bacterium]|nr:MAG: PDZ domain-containing protein [Phycisphaerales bacterium]
MSARATILAAILMVCSLSPDLHSAELKGTVQAVMGKKITIKIQPDLLPNPGDKVEVFDEVPGIGEVALDCQWTVESIDGDLVTAVTEDKSGATAQQGYKAIIYSTSPRRPLAAVESKATETEQEERDATTEPEPVLVRQPAQQTETIAGSPQEPPVEEQKPARLPRIVFADNFDSENAGRGQLNYDRFRNWHLTSGAVDLIGKGFWDFFPEKGLYIDLDGNINKAGTLQTKNAFKLNPGTYRLEFDLAGHPLRGTNTTTVSLGRIYSEDFTLNVREPFRTISRDIQVSSVEHANIVFQHEGADNAGLILDNVRLTALADGQPPVVTPPVTVKDTKVEPIKPPQTKPPRKKTAYLGVLVVRHPGGGVKIVEVREDSPAEHAGLRSDDVILGIEEKQFNQRDFTTARFGQIISTMPTNKPLGFRIQRKTKKFNVWVQLREVDAKQIATRNQDVKTQVLSDFDKGKLLMEQRNYTAAIECFRKTLESRPRESYQALGICYYHNGLFRDGLNNIVKAYKMDRRSPLNVFYLAACSDKLGNSRDAIYYYKRYLGMRHNDSQMQATARTRLNALTAANRNKQQETAQKVLQIVDAIIKETRE